ncbi:MAG: hypothetical protein AB9M60_00385 [Leptothrix sp. (in: b-proteobacteria)]
MTHYTCDPLNTFGSGAAAQRISFEWDPAKGLDKSSGSAALLDVVRGGRVLFGSYPRYYVAAPKSIRTASDLALVIGHAWVIPADLLPFYPPEPEQDLPPGAVN